MLDLCNDLQIYDKTLSELHQNMYEVEFERDYEKLDIGRQIYYEQMFPSELYGTK